MSMWTLFQAPRLPLVKFKSGEYISTCRQEQDKYSSTIKSLMQVQEVPNISTIQLPIGSIYPATFYPHVSEATQSDIRRSSLDLSHFPLSSVRPLIGGSFDSASPFSPAEAQPVPRRRDRSDGPDAHRAKTMNMFLVVGRLGSRPLHQPALPLPHRRHSQVPTSASSALPFCSKSLR